MTVERGLRLVGSAQRGAALLIGLRKPFPRRCHSLCQLSDARGGPVATVAQFLHSQLDLRTLGGEGVEAVLAHQSLACGRAVAARDEAVPAPHRAVGRDEPLPDGKRLVVVLIGHRDLREAARKRGRCGDVRGECFGPGGERGVAVGAFGAEPTARGIAVGPRVEIVAERRRERGLVTGRNANLVEDAVRVAARRRERAFERRRFAVERSERRARFGERGFDFAGVGGAGGAVGLGLVERTLGVRDRPFRCGGGGPALVELCCERIAVAERRDLGVDAALVLFDPAQRCGRAVARRHGDAAVGGLARGLRARLRERNLRVAQPRLRCLVGFDKCRLASGLRSNILRELAALGIQCSQRGVCLARKVALALAVSSKPLLLRRQIVEPLTRRTLFALKPRLRRARFGKRIALRLCLAARLCNACRDLGLCGGDGFELGLRGLDRGFRRIGIAPRLIGRRGGVAPARIDQPPFGDANLVRQPLVAFGGARLAAQRIGAHLHIGDDFGQAVQICFGRAQFLLGVLAADVQPGDPGCLFEHRAAVRRFGGDDVRNFALTDERGTMRAGCGVGKDQRDILGADVAAVGAIGAARAAFDAADDFQLVPVARVGEPRDDGAFGVAMDRDFGKVARRPRRRARKDDVLHPAAAHRLGRGFAHHPADRLEQVRLAAAVRPDDAGQTGLDAQFGGFDEAFETGKAQPLYLHEATPCRSPNRRPCNLCVTNPPWLRHAARAGESQGGLNGRTGGKSRLARAHRSQPVAHRAPGRDAFGDLPVDNEGRRAANLVFFDAVVRALFDGGHIFDIGEALLHRVRGNAARLIKFVDFPCRSHRVEPLGGGEPHRAFDLLRRSGLCAAEEILMLEEGRIGEREIALGAGAFDDRARDGIDRMEHEGGELERYAAGVDEIALQLLVRILGELGAVAAGEGAIFLNLDRRFGVAHHRAAVGVKTYDL